MIEEAKFTYSPLGTRYGKQRKIIDEQWKKQVEDLRSLDLNNQQMKPYQPETKSIEDIFPKHWSKQKAMNELKEFL